MGANDALVQHDAKTAWRCPRLGDTVPFRYCRTVNGGLPCPTILACWQERFDIAAFLEANYDAETLRKILHQDRPGKAAQLVDLIRKAREG